MDLQSRTENRSHFIVHGGSQVWKRACFQLSRKCFWFLRMNRCWDCRLLKLPPSRKVLLQDSFQKTGSAFSSFNILLPLHIYAHACTHDSCKSYGSVTPITRMMYCSQLGGRRETVRCLFGVVGSGWKVNRYYQPSLLRKGEGGSVLNKNFGARLH